MPRATFTSSTAMTATVMTATPLLLALALAAGPLAGEAAARARRPAHRTAAHQPDDVGGYAASPPSRDAVGLGTLAPPTRLSTLEQTYGDAAYARARVLGREASRGQDRFRESGAGGADARVLSVQFPCDPRSAGVAAYRCGPPAGVPGQGLPGYGLAYAYNPAYVTSPFSSGHDPREQPPVLPGVTGLFFAVNGLGAGHGD